jgi:glycosyltransferase involved in cell wall biosynthesis
MSAPTKVLFVTYSFPPEAEVGGKRAARFCRYLPEFGIEPAVLTVDPRYYEAIDATYAPSPGLEVIRTGALTNPLDWYGRAMRWRRRRSSASPEMLGGPHRTEPANSSRNLVYTIRRNLLQALGTPDRYWGWYWSAARAGVDFVRARKPDAILSSAPPWTSHLVACRVHRKTGVPWIADFRDPWTLSPWREALPGWIHRFEQHLERSVIEQADRIVCVASEIAEDFRKTYQAVPGDKFVTITNGIEGDPVFSEARHHGPKRLLLHLGSLYGDRRIRPLLQAVVELARSGAISPESLRFLFVGLIDPQMAREASEEISYLEQFEAIEFRERVPFEEGQRLLASSDVLLLFQGSNRVTVPAKLFEYLSAGKPILVVAKPGSLTRLISESSLGLWADSDDREAIAAEFLKCLRLPPRTAAEFESIVRRFHFRTLTKELVEVIREAAARSSCTAASGCD